MTSAEFSEWRKRIGLTQDGVAERFKVSRSTIQNWESGAAPISHIAAQMCSVWEHRLRQENGALGPVTLNYADGPMWVDAYAPRRIAMVQMEPFRTNSAALGRVLERWGDDDFKVPMIWDQEDEILWTTGDLVRVVTGQDEGAPTPDRWRAKAIRDVADYVGKVAIRYPVRSGARLWSPEERAAWEARVHASVAALEALADQVPNGTVTLRRVEEVLDALRAETVFPSPEAHHQLVAAYL